MVDSTKSRIGTVLAGKYRLDREIGRGGMGAVYRAFHLRVHKEFAVKLLLTDAAEHQSIAQRFFLEAQAAGRIGHPGILDVYDVGEDEKGVPFIVMELLRGEPLGAYIRRHRPAPETSCWIAEHVLEILSAAHKAGVVHRDVKPQNVFLCQATGATRTVKLLDFGIAKFASSPDASALTRSGEIIGSPLYMAPEQAKGELDVDARADVWSVGAMLFEMLTGKAAHAAPTPVAVLAKILTEPAPPPSTMGGAAPTELDAIVQRALSIDRATRFANALEMLDALRAARKVLEWSVDPPSFPEPDPQVLVDEKSSSGAITSTIEAPSGREGAEPSLEAAVTNDRETKSRPWAMIAVAVLGIAVAIPFVMSSNAPKPAPAPSAAAAAPPPVASSAPPIETASAAPSVEPAPKAPASSAPSVAPVKPAALPPPTIKPQCGATEVLSNGHCCPRGLAWQDGRCERPLATSF